MYSSNSVVLTFTATLKTFKNQLLTRILSTYCIADTEKFYTEVQEIILSRYNKTFDWSLKAKMMGKKAIEAARVFVEESGISDSLSAEDFLVEREDMLRTMFPTSNLMPGIISSSKIKYATAILFIGL